MLIGMQTLFYIVEKLKRTFYTEKVKEKGQTLSSHTLKESGQSLRLALVEMAVDEEEDWVPLQLESGQTDIIAHGARKRKSKESQKAILAQHQVFESPPLVMLF